MWEEVVMDIGWTYILASSYGNWDVGSDRKDWKLGRGHESCTLNVDVVMLLYIGYQQNRISSTSDEMRFGER